MVLQPFQNIQNFQDVILDDEHTGDQPCVTFISMIKHYSCMQVFMKGGIIYDTEPN